MASGNFRVLIVEDNQADLIYTMRMLESPNLDKKQAFQIETRNTLGDALDALITCCHDVVLLDLNLPDSTGLETFYKIHSLFPDVPILILTGLMDENLSWHALNEGANDYLVKGDYDEITLAKTILETLKRNKPGSKV